VWRHTPIIPALGKLRLEDGEFEVSLGYIVRSVSTFKKEEAGHHVPHL
jgi:hypothetical protein